MRGMMKESDPICKPENTAIEPAQPASCHFDPARLPGLIGELLAGRQILDGLGEDDLREMSKLREAPNIEGLSAHRVERPMARGFDPARPGVGQGPRAIARRPELPIGIYRVLMNRIGAESFVIVRGWAAGASARPMAVQVVWPQSQAHLAAGMRRMLWTAEDQTLADPQDGEIAYTLLVWPEPLLHSSGRVMLEGLIGHWPADRAGIVIGCDDPRLAAELILDAGRRYWSEPAGEEFEISQGQRWAGIENEEGEERVRRLPAQNPADRVAAAEPLLIEPGGAVSPVWSDPLLPATMLHAEPWRQAALNPWSLPFGVEVDAEGRFSPLDNPQGGTRDDELEQESAGCFVVPRRAVPHPYLNQASRFSLVSDP